MKINGINGANTQMGQMGMNQATDSYSRNIQSQIANAQKQLQELSSNEGYDIRRKDEKKAGDTAADQRPEYAVKAASGRTAKRETAGKGNIYG